MNFHSIITVLKMIYKLLCFMTTTITFLLNTFWICCTLASAGIPWFTLIFIIICILSKFIKLKSPPNCKHFFEIDEEDQDEVSSVTSNLSANNKTGTESVKKSPPTTTSNNADSSRSRSSSSITTKNCLYWPIANRGASFDAPENSVTAIKKCIGQNCKNILLDMAITKCDEFVIVHKTTIEKAGIQLDGIDNVTFNSLQNINISEQHPLGNQYQPEKILSLANLLTLLDINLNVNIFLLVSAINSKCIEKLKELVRKDEMISKRCIICCTSPIAIYQLRKHCPELICGLWIESTSTSSSSALSSGGRISINNFLPNILRMSTLLMPIYIALLRNIIAPVIGISIVFINKEDMNVHLANQWKNVGIRPIVYSVNSPNEKRYYQKVIKVQYVTDSLRSEPQCLLIKTL